MMTLMEPSVTSGLEAGQAADLAAASLAMARCFAAGATLWCVAPQWPSHGRHVAVEFVHPVIMGKRALPAVSVDAAGAIAAVRLAARPGDILLTVSTADDSSTPDLLARADAWGLTSLWLGVGSRPTGSRARHVIWLEGVDPALASRSGDMVLMYHLLWELTHVGLEHPGLLEAQPECTEGACVTCSDEGRVAEVTAVQGEGRVEALAGGRREVVDTSLVDRAEPGDLLLVHAGVAITSLGGARS
jgi:hydrogenase maturation factor